MLCVKHWTGDTTNFLNPRVFYEIVTLSCTPLGSPTRGTLTPPFRGPFVSEYGTPKPKPRLFMLTLARKKSRHYSGFCSFRPFRAFPYLSSQAPAMQHAYT